MLPKLRNRSWSIVFRISAAYAAITIALLSISGACLYWCLKVSLDENARSTLADKISVLRQILRERPDDEEALEEEVKWESTARHQSVFYGRLQQNDGTLVMQSPGAENLIPDSSKCPPAANENQWLGETREYRPGPDKTMLLASAKMASPPVEKRYSNPDRHFVYTVALDTTPEQRILGDYRNNLLLVLIGGSIASAVAGTHVAKRGIRPIHQISAAAHRITANALADRVGATAWPRELAGLAAEFDGMLQRLEESFKRLSQFSADIAHELRTPINNLMGEAEVALRRVRSSEEYARVIASSLEEYHRLSALIDSLLFLARAENADLLLHRKWFQASEELTQILSYHELQASEQGITLLSFGDAQIYADATLFRRALSNVIANALKHTASGGTVTVRVREKPITNASSPAETGPTASGGVELLIEDTGEGIPPEHLSRIFDRFYRVDTSRARSTVGIGLGLAIVKTIMELHAGSADVKSELGKGTCVSLVFPRPNVTQQIPSRDFQIA
ncbi:MAG: heavy metal sensor histidine kinase [Verrucomicrobia bacterium]|nr:heavy metal sensor histidine kinase [Verrucomicrobiota bacterium]